MYRKIFYSAKCLKTGGANSLGVGLLLGFYNNTFGWSLKSQNSLLIFIWQVTVLKQCFQCIEWAAIGFGACWGKGHPFQEIQRIFSSVLQTWSNVAFKKIILNKRNGICNGYREQSMSVRRYICPCCLPHGLECEQTLLVSATLQRQNRQHTCTGLLTAPPCITWNFSAKLISCSCPESQQKALNTNGTAGVGHRNGSFTLRENLNSSWDQSLVMAKDI